MRTVNFRDVVLSGIAVRMGMDPRSDLLTQEVNAWVIFVNLWVAKLWDKIDFPEWTVIEKRTPNLNHEISYDAAGLTPLGKVLKVYLCDPRTTRGPLDTPYRLSDFGVHVGFEHGTFVWLKFMLRPPRFTGLPFDGTKLYAVGDLVYDPVTGECYTAGPIVIIDEDPPPGPPPSVADGVTTATDKTLTSATAIFNTHDVGASVTGTGIPEGAVIESVTDATSVELSIAATATAAGVKITIGPTLEPAYEMVELSFATGSTTSGSDVLTVSSAAFTAKDVGRLVTGAGIPAGTYIKSVTNGTTVVLSNNATATATPMDVQIPPPLGRWVKVDFPFQLAELVIRGVYADVQRSEGQTDKALAEEQSAVAAVGERAASQMGDDFDMLTDQVRPARQRSGR